MTDLVALTVFRSAPPPYVSPKRAIAKLEVRFSDIKMIRVYWAYYNDLIQLLLKYNVYRVL